MFDVRVRVSARVCPRPPGPRSTFTLLFTHLIKARPCVFAPLCVCARACVVSLVSFLFSFAGRLFAVALRPDQGSSGVIVTK